MLTTCKKHKFVFQTGSFAYFFTLFFAVIVMPILVFGGIFAWQFKESSTNTVIDQADKCLSNVYSNMESLISGIEQTAQQYVTSNWVKKITYIQSDTIPAARVSTENYRDYTQNLQIAVLNNALTDMSAIIFTSKDFVVSSDGIANADVFFSNVYKSDVTYDSLKNNRWAQPLMLISQTGINAGMHWPPVSAGKVIFYVSRLLENNHGDTLFMSYLPIKSMSRSITSYLNDDDFALSVSLNDGQLLYQNKQENGYVLERTGRFFTYKLTVPTYVFEHTLVPIMTILTAALALLLALTALAAFTLSLRQIKHVLSLEKSIKPPVNDAVDKFSISYEEIEHDAVALNSQNLTIISENAMLRPLAISQLLLRLLTGSVNEAETALNSLRSYDIVLDNPMFMLMNVCLSTPDGLCIDDKQLNKQSEELERCLNALLPSSFIVAVRIPSAKDTILFNCPESANITEIMSNVEAYFVKAYGADFGVLMFSNMYRGVVGAHTAYDELKKLSNYRLFNQSCDTHTLTFYQAQQECAIFYYPCGVENKLVAALTDNNREVLNCTLADIFARNNELKWMSSNQLHILLFSLIYTARRALGASNVHTRLFINFLQVQDISSIAEASKYVSELFDEVANMIKDEREHSDDTLGIKLKVFIDANFRQQELSLAMLSAETGKPEYIISREFKRKYGIGFADYVQNLRIQEAQKLIAHGCQLKDLAQMVGFGSDITFRRAFKKVTAQLPSEYIEAISQKIIN